MSDTVFKTYPRLFILTMTFLGTIFMGTFAFILYPLTKTLISQINTTTFISISVLLLFSLFILVSVYCLYFFLTTKTIRLTKDKLVINYLFLPYKKTFDLADVQTITQKSKLADAVLLTFNKWNLFTNHLTTITLTNGKQYKINSVGQSDYEILMSSLRKLKGGQTTFAIKNRTLSNYLLTNLDGLPWLIISVILTIGLVYNIVGRQS